MRFDVKNEPKRITLIFIDGGKAKPTVDGTYTRDGDAIEIEFPEWRRDDDAVKLRLSLRRAKD